MLEYSGMHHFTSFWCTCCRQQEKTSLFWGRLLLAHLVLDIHKSVGLPYSTQHLSPSTRSYGIWYDTHAAVPGPQYQPVHAALRWTDTQTTLCVCQYPPYWQVEPWSVEGMDSKEGSVDRAGSNLWLGGQVCRCFWTTPLERQQAPTLLRAPTLFFQSI